MSRRQRRTPCRSPETPAERTVEPIEATNCGLSLEGGSFVFSHSSISLGPVHIQPRCLSARPAVICSLSHANSDLPAG